MKCIHQMDYWEEKCSTCDGNKSCCLSITENDILQGISEYLTLASKLWHELSVDTQNRINNLHNKGFTLAYCLRWGEAAIKDACQDINICEEDEND